jgi:1-acyl-sn-glycerol-3-phosphate acyltransferase
LFASTGVDRDLPDKLEFRDAGHGYDVFGLNPHVAARALRWIEPLYTYYFRVRSYNAHHIPERGAAILAANHSGLLPLDGVMLYADIVKHTAPPRVPRILADLFVSRLPLIGTLFARAGVVSGARRNLRRLLDRGELIAVFPEGTPGIGKQFRQRYHLQDWRVGHAELAIRHRAPVVPVAIIGPEEQWPVVARIDAIRPFGAPYLPIPAVPFPLPVRYHIHYGTPLYLHEGLGADGADDPAAVDAAADRIKRAVQALIDAGLEQRPGVFR